MLDVPGKVDVSMSDEMARKEGGFNSLGKYVNEKHKEYEEILERLENKVFDIEDYLDSVKKMEVVVSDHTKELETTMNKLVDIGKVDMR